MRLKRRINIGIVLVIIINLFGTINISANSTEIPNYSIWKLDALMGQSTDATFAERFNEKDEYDYVINKEFYYRDTYNKAVDYKIYDPLQEWIVAWWDDDIEYSSHPEYFYDVILADILQNAAINTTTESDYQADISSEIYTLGNKLLVDLGDIIMDDVEHSYEKLLNNALKNDEEITEVADALKAEIIDNYNYKEIFDNIDNDMDFIEKVLKIGKSYEKALTEVVTLLETAKYSLEKINILQKMYDLSNNDNLKASLKKQIDAYTKYTDPNYVYTYTDFASTVASTSFKNVSITVNRMVIEHIIHSFVDKRILATWEIGTSLADILFNTTDSATAYLMLKTTVEIEDILRVVMREYRTQYNENKTILNATLCIEAYKLALTNAYNGTIVLQEFAYAITKSGLIINIWHGDKEYNTFADLSEINRNEIKELYYKEPNFILKCYGLIFYHTDDMSVLASISTEDIEDGSKTIFNGINPWNLSSNYTIEAGEMIVVDSLNLSGGTLLLEEDSVLVVRGDVTQTKGTLDVGKGEVSVGGDYNQRRGVLNVSAGKITINGNYTANNNYNDLSGTNCITMQNPAGYMLVNGDFYVAVDGSNQGQLTAGTLELKGNFTQRGGRTGWTYVGDSHSVYGFCATGTHKVIFSGTGQQNISRQTWQTYNGAEQINYPNCSYFSIVKSTNPDVVFSNDFFVKNIEEGSIFKTLRIKSVNLSNTEFQVNGTFYATDTTVVDSTITAQTLNISLGTTTLENSELQVIGNADHKGGNLTVKTGKLLVNGNYNHTGGELIAGKGYTEIKGDYTATGSCNLVMQDELGYVLIYGDYYVEKDNDSTGCLTAGTLELKGNFSQYGGKRGIGYLGNPASAYGFCGSDKHIVILSGEEKQTIYTQSTGLFGSLYRYPACSYFNILKIKNTSADGINFTSTVYVLEDIEQPTGTNLSNKESVYLDNKSAFVDYGELNPTINAYVLNAVDVIPTYMDYEEYMATQILSIELENIKMEQNKITGNVLFDNQRTDFENILCIIATYENNEDNNELINCTIIPLSIKHKETKDINFSLNITKKATDVKAFVWTDLETMTSLCESISRTIQ